MILGVKITEKGLAVADSASASLDYLDIVPTNDIKIRNQDS